ncbi:MAG: hypothetical protein ABW167_07560 [Baekduia sp.]
MTELEQPPPDSPVKNLPKPPGFCLHERVALDGEKHKVFCRECAEEIDPYAFLSRLAGNWHRYEDAVTHAQREAKVAEEKLAKVKRELINAKSRLRAAKARWEGTYEDSMQGRFPMPPMGREADPDIDSD